MTRTDMKTTKDSFFFKQANKCKVDLDPKIRVSAGNEELSFQPMSKRFTILTFSKASPLLL